MFRFFAAAVVILALLAAAPSVAVSQGDRASQGDKAGLKAQVEQLLEAGWPRTVKARNEAQTQYRQLQPLAASDARIDYAYALIQIQQFRYPEAAKLIDRVIAADKQNVTARRLKIWLAVQGKQYETALVELPRLAGLLPADEAPGDAEIPHLEIARFLGRLCGFMEGPVKKGVDQAALSAAAEKITGKLTTRRKAAFENGRKVVLQQFSAMGEETDMTSAAAKEAAEKQKKRLLGDLERKGEELAARAEAEQARLEKLKEELTYEIDKLDSDDRQVVPQAQQAAAQAAALRRDLRTIDIRIAQLYDMAEREKDPVQRQIFLDDAAAWRLRRHQRAAAAMEADRRLADLNAQHLALVQKRREIDARWQRESGHAEKLQGSLKRLHSDKVKAEKMRVTGETMETAGQKSRAATLSTYVPMPVSLEDEKTKLLESFQ